MHAPLGFQVILRLPDDNVLAPTAQDRRVLAATVLEIGRDFGLLAFRAADTHLHVQVACAPEQVGRFVQRLVLALAHRLALACAPSVDRIVRIADQWHRESTFYYVLRQTSRHDLAYDPLHDASALPDLLGLRVGGEHLRELACVVLPRARRARLLEILALPEPRPLSVLPQLAEATVAAACLPSLRGDVPAVARARVAAVHAAGADPSARAIAAALGLAPRSVERMRARPADPALVAAIRLQIGLREELTGRPGRGLARWETDLVREPGGDALLLSWTLQPDRAAVTGPPRARAPPRPTT